LFEINIEQLENFPTAHPEDTIPCSAGDEGSQRSFTRLPKAFSFRMMDREKKLPDPSKNSFLNNEFLKIMLEC